MSITKQWHIERLETTTTSDQKVVVTQVHWECTGTDGEFSGRVFKLVELGEPNLENFTNYADLTKQQVIAWVHEKMTPEIVNYWETLVDIQIEKQKRPKVVDLDLPWK